MSRRIENLREPCPVCHKNLVELGSPYCFECSKKKPLFGDN